MTQIAVRYFLLINIMCIYNWYCTVLFYTFSHRKQVSKFNNSTLKSTLEKVSALTNYDITIFAQNLANMHAYFLANRRFFSCKNP